ncbi:hypothetical protein Tco_0389827 [Tanacetum coccineum]
MAGPEPITPLNEGTSNQTTKSIIEGHVSALKELLKEPSNRDIIKPMLLDFDDVQDEVLKCPFTRRIVKFSSPGHRMPANAKIYDGKGDPEDHVGRFVGMGNQGEWRMPIRDAQGLRQRPKGNFKNSPEGKRDPPSLQGKIAKRFSDNIPKTVDDMLKRVDDYLRSEEAFRSTELPRHEFQQKDMPIQASERHASYVPPQRPNQELRRPREIRAVLTLDSLLSTPQEILTTEHQLRLPQTAPLVGVPNKENLNRYCDYHNEEGHNTDYCFHLKQQLEIALESGKLNHLIKDVRQRGRAGQQNQDEGASVEIMFEQCFNMLHPSIRARLVETQTIVLGFSREHVNPLGKIELDVCFGGSGLCRRAIMKLTIILAPSPYNIILGRPGLKQLRALPSIIHEMMKFPTPWGIATLVSQAPIIFEWRREGKKQAVERPEETEPQETVSLTEQVLANPPYPEQLVVIGKGEHFCMGACRYD